MANYSSIPKPSRVKRLLVDVKNTSKYWKTKKAIDNKKILSNKDNFVLSVGAYNELKYYNQLLGQYARFQLLKAMNILKIDETETAKVALRVKDKYGKHFYVTSLTPEFLLENSYVHRRSEFEDELGGYQRFLEEKKIADIRAYVEAAGQSNIFPNAIILKSDEPLAVDPISINESENIQENDQVVPVKIKISKSFLSFKIVDGQHRVSGFAKMTGDQKSWFFLPVVIFDNLNDEGEIQMFIDINSTQKSVDPNLVSLLLSNLAIPINSKLFQKKIASRVGLILNQNTRSPFHETIYLHKTTEHKKSKNMITITGICAALKSDSEFNALIKLSGGDDQKISAYSDELITDLCIMKGCSKGDFVRLFTTNAGFGVFLKIRSWYKSNKENIKMEFSKLIETIYTDKNTLIPDSITTYGSGAAKILFETYFKNELSNHIVKNKKKG